MERFNSDTIDLLNNIDFDQFYQELREQNPFNEEDNTKKEVSYTSTTDCEDNSYSTPEHWKEDSSLCPFVEYPTTCFEELQFRYQASEVKLPDDTAKKSTKITLIIEIPDDICEAAQAKRAAKALVEQTALNHMIENCMAQLDKVNIAEDGDCQALDIYHSKNDAIVDEAIRDFLNNRSSEEAAYIESIMPYLMDSLKTFMKGTRVADIDSKMIYSILTQLVYEREIMISTENELIKRIVAREVKMLALSRPQEKFDVNVRIFNQRKNKKSIKGNKNGSSFNHVNENYISNIYKFARQSYPEDEDLNQLASKKGTSASNFRNTMTPKLTDSISYRKAKVRIVETGQEFVKNIEYWMQDGFFENSNDKEKYIHFREHAFNNLALDKLY